MALFTSRDFCLCDITTCDTLHNLICLLCLLNASLNSLWLYGIVYIMWHLFMLCGCDWPLNLKLTELTTWFCLHQISLPHAVCKQMWLICVFNLALMSLSSYDIFYITWHLFTPKADWVKPRTFVSMICLYHKLYVNKYGGYANWNLILLWSRDICVNYVGVGEFLSLGWTS